MQKLFQLFVLSIIISLSIQFMDVNNVCSSNPLRLVQLNKHEIVTLGSGSFGKVKGDDYVAIKEMKINDIKDKQRFNMEIKTLIAADKEFDLSSIIEDGCYYTNMNSFNTYPIKVKLGMQRMLGDINKVRLINSMKKLNENVFWKIDMAIKMLLALRKLHKSQLLHMDIKTDNVFMMNKYTPALGDFGLAHTFKNAVKETDRMGTQIYVAFEIVSDTQPEYSEKSDVYAMGVTIYELFQKVSLQNEISYKKIPDMLKNSLTKSFNQAFLKALDYRNKHNRQTVNELIYDLFVLLKTTVNSDGNTTVLHNGENMKLFDQYLLEEEEYYDNYLWGISEQYKEVLKEKFQQRKQMYMKFINGGIKNRDFEIPYTKQLLTEDVEKYCQTQEDINQFMTDNLAQNLLVKTIKRAVSNDFDKIKPKSKFNMHDRKVHEPKKFVSKQPIKQVVVQPKKQVIQQAAQLDVIDEKPQKLIINKVREVHPYPKPTGFNRLNATQQKPNVQQFANINKSEKKQWAKNNINI